MTKTRRTFTDEFKREATALLESSGRPLMQVAAELGIQPALDAAQLARHHARRRTPLAGWRGGIRLGDPVPAVGGRAGRRDRAPQA